MHSRTTAALNGLRLIALAACLGTAAGAVLNAREAIPADTVTVSTEVAVFAPVGAVTVSTTASAAVVISSASLAVFSGTEPVSAVPGADEASVDSAPGDAVEPDVSTDIAPPRAATVNIERMRFNQALWNRVRNRVEADLPPYEVPKTTVAASPVFVPPISISGTTIEFMPGTELRIAGRKLIGVDFNTTQYPNATDAGRGSSNVTMKQEMQVTIDGKVGNNVDVRVDIDDRYTDKRDISIVYRGEQAGATPGQGEVGYKGSKGSLIREAAFGDIMLSLQDPAGFMGYNRQVFGIRATGQVGRAEIKAIASQTKGNYGVKQFTGNAQKTKRILADTAYVRRKYYRMAFGDDDIRDIGRVEVYYYNGDPTSSNHTRDIGYQAYQSTAYPQFSGTGRFERLQLGRDYAVIPGSASAETGILLLTMLGRFVPNNSVIAVDYVDNTTGRTLRERLGTTNYVLLKDVEETPGVCTELLNRYSLGVRNIVQDNGAGNFILKVVNKGTTQEPERITDAKAVPLYPRDVAVDFTNGEFWFRSAQPFDDRSYTKTPQSFFDIYVEYTARQKDYPLGQGFLVPQSERVTVDGRVLERDRDYYIDYDIGQVTLLRDDLVTDKSNIEISYEYTNFGMQGGETQAGAQVKVPLNDNITVGGTWLGNLPSRGTSIPDIRSLVSRNAVWEGHVEARDLRFPILNEALQARLPRITSMFYEYAESNKDPNIWDKAIVENMEGITTEDGASMYRDFWRYAATASGGTYFPGQYDRIRREIVGGELNWRNEDIPARDINPNRGQYNERQQVLSVSYDLFRSSEVAMVYVLSRDGLDFSQKLYVEYEVFSDGGGAGPVADLWLDLGQINEDADGDGVMDTEDTIIPNRQLDMGEDTGIGFRVDGTTSVVVGRENGLLDTEDLDLNGVFRSYETPETVPGRYNLGPLNFTGWRTGTVALNISTATAQLWTAIKHLRLRVLGRGARGQFKLARVTVVGNRWRNETPAVAELVAVNNENTPGYPKLTELEDYRNIYENPLARDRNVEQALAVRYAFTALSDAATFYNTIAVNLANHREMSFFLYNDGNEVEFRLRAYSSPGNYVEYSTVTAPWSSRWQKFTLTQVDLTQDEIPDRWAVPEGAAYGGVCASSGIPNLLAITRLEIIMRPTRSPQSGTLYVNDLYVSNSWKRTGTARRFQVDFLVPGFATFGSAITSRDRNFETLGGGINKSVDSQDISANLTVTALSFLPVTFSANQSRVITPREATTQELVSVLEEGETNITNGTVSASFTRDRFPTVSAVYRKAVSSQTSLSRTDINDNLSLNINYSVPFKPLTSLAVTFSDDHMFNQPWDFTATASTVTYTKRFNITMPFDFWGKLHCTLSGGAERGFSEFRGSTAAIFNDGLNVPVLDDNANPVDYWIRLVLFTLNNADQRYPEGILSSADKRRAWNGRIDTTIGLLPFLKPSVNYAATLDETLNAYLPDRKTVSRNTTMGGSFSFTPRDLTGAKAVRTMNLSYTFGLTYGDSYVDIPKDVPVFDLDIGRFSLRNPETLWFQTDLTTASVYRQTQSDTRTQNASLRWNPLEGLPLTGPLAFLASANMSATYLHEDRKTENYRALSQTRTYGPSITATVSGFDQLLRLFRSSTTTKPAFLSNASLTAEITHRTTNNIANAGPTEDATHLTHRENLNCSLFTDYSIGANFSNTRARTYSHQIGAVRSWTDDISAGITVGFPFLGQRLSPAYTLTRNYTYDNINRLPTTDMVTHALSLNYFANITPRGGITLPFIGRVPLQNQIRANTGLTYRRQESTLSVADSNLDAVDLTGNVEYNVSRFIWVRFDAGGGYTSYRYADIKNNYRINASGQVTITF